VPKLKKFTEFADSLFPSEVEYVVRNNQFSDPEILSILDTIESRVSDPYGAISFNEEIDPRKYSKLIASINKKLKERNVDSYFEWISHLNHCITVDSITPKDQASILKEIKLFEPGWFHMDAFYHLLENYKSYLLRRFRKDDFTTVDDFLKRYRNDIDQNKRVEEKISDLTEKIVFEGVPALTEADRKWLLSSFRNEKLSKKNRFFALVSYLMHSVASNRSLDLESPLDEFEKKVFEGAFYSRRILANLYANKLIVQNAKGDYEKAAYYGFQSIKHRTQDYLYYLNNYVSVLIHLRREKEALNHMLSAFQSYQKSLDLARRVVFISNYIKCLNALGRHKKSVGMGARFCRENGLKLFQFRWHYFFRMYLLALLKTGNSEHMIKLNRQYKLVEKERQMKYNPHISALMLAAEYREIRLSKSEFENQIGEINPEMEPRDADFSALLGMIRADLP
jgi:hypothetical protein